jgi:hypothetical protein
MEQNIATIEYFGQVCERFGVDCASEQVLPRCKPRDATGAWIPFRGTLCFTTGREMAVAVGNDRVLRKVARQVERKIYPCGDEMGSVAPL